MTDPNPHSSTLRAIDHSALNDMLPVGMLLIDPEGIIRHANRRAMEMTGYTLDDAVGRSIVEFVHADDFEFLVSSLTHAHVYVDSLLGPVRLRYISRDGSAHWTECWTQTGSNGHGVDGYVVTLTIESVTDNVANAVRQVAAGDPLDSSLATLARAVAGSPLVATGSIVLVDDGATRVIGHWPFLDAAGEPQFLCDLDMPWHDALLTAQPIDLYVDELPNGLVEPARAAGFESVWIRPVTTRESVAAAFVAWRTEPGGASPNQDRHLSEVVAATSLAFESARHRTTLERAAQSDTLTGLGNRAALALHLNRVEFDRLAVLYIDLDWFKEVNDRYGHAVGDQVLSITARRLSAAIREGDRVFRVGGDEFVVVCHHLAEDSDVAAGLAERIIATLREPIRVDEETINIGASVGVAHRSPGERTAQVIQRADQALLAAKQAGKSRWRQASPA